MPIYVYECECGQVIEMNHPMSETPDVECDNCDSMMHRMFTPPVIQFKGSGFYSNEKK